MSDPRVDAIRADEKVGRGTCSVVDECYTDAELSAELDGMGIGPRACTEAVRRIRRMERIRREYADDIRGA